MVRMSYHLWTLISLSPTWCLPRLLRHHWLPSFSWLSADQVHSSWPVSLHPCSVPILSSWLQGFCQCTSCLRGKTPGGPESLLLHLCGHWPHSQSLDGRLANGFFGGIPWWIVEWYSLNGSAVDHTIEWSIERSHIIALKDIFLKQNLCNLNTFTLMSSTHKHGSWV